MADREAAILYLSILSELWQFLPKNAVLLYMKQVVIVFFDEFQGHRLP